MTIQKVKFEREIEIDLPSDPMQTAQLLKRSSKVVNQALDQGVQQLKETRGGAHPADPAPARGERRASPSSAPSASEMAILVRKAENAWRAAAKPMRESGWRELVDTRAEFKQYREKIAGGALAASRELTELEADVVLKLDNAIEALDKELDRRSASGSKDGHPTAAGRTDGSSTRLDNGGVLFRDVHTGRLVRSYGVKDRLDDRSGPDRGAIGIGHIAMRCITGQWSDKQIQEEARAMSIGSDSAGGYLVPEPISREVIDLARALSVVSKAGARVVPMDTSTLDLARIESDPTWGWKAENATGFGSSDLTLGRVRLSAKTVGTIIPLSEELWQDGMNVAEVLEGVITRSIAAEIDRVCLHGSGSGAEPSGIYVNSSANTFNLASAPTNYDFVSQAVEEVRTDNLEPNAMVAHPRTYGQLERLKEATTNAPLQPNEAFRRLQHFHTTNVRVNIEGGGSPNDDSAAFIGKWDELLIGMRLGLQLIADRTGYDGTNNAMTEYKVLLRAVMRMDLALMRPTGFCVVKKIQRV